VGLLLKPCVEGGSRDERIKKFFSVISLLCSAGIPADKRGGKMIGTGEMGHWGGKREDNIKIWMRVCGFMAGKGKSRRFWNNHIENIMKPGISLASLRPQGRSFIFTHSVHCSGGSDSTHQPDWRSAQLNALAVHSAPPESHLMLGLLSPSQEKVLFPIRYNFTKLSSLKLKISVRFSASS